MRCQTSTTTFFVLTPLAWIAGPKGGGRNSVVSALGMVSSIFNSGRSSHSKLSTDLLSNPDELMRDRCYKRRNMLWVPCKQLIMLSSPPDSSIAKLLEHRSIVEGLIEYASDYRLRSYHFPDIDWREKESWRFWIVICRGLRLHA